MRMYAFMWLSATWCTTWRTVQPPGRYGVSSCASVRPVTAARSCAAALRRWRRSRRVARPAVSGARRSARPIGIAKVRLGRRGCGHGAVTVESRRVVASYRVRWRTRGSALRTSRVASRPGIRYNRAHADARAHDREEAPTREEAARQQRQVAVLPPAGQAGRGHGVPASGGQSHRRQAVRHDGRAAPWRSRS